LMSNVSSGHTLVQDCEKLVAKQANQDLKQVLLLPAEICCCACGDVQIKNHSQHMDKAPANCLIFIRSIDFRQDLERRALGNQHAYHLLSTKPRPSINQDLLTLVASDFRTASNFEHLISKRARKCQGPAGDGLNRQIIPLFDS